MSNKLMHSFNSLKSNRLFKTKICKSKLSQDLQYWRKLLIEMPVERKIEFLKELAIKKYDYNFKYDKVRKGRIPGKVFKGELCEICGKSETIPHHIIQVQNGGTNHKDNIILLCNNCHYQIHPWLKQ